MKRIGTTTKVSTCGHCGKKGLARTVVFERRDRSKVYLGSDCAKHRGNVAFVETRPASLIDRYGRVVAKGSAKAMHRLKREKGTGYRVMVESGGDTRRLDRSNVVAYYPSRTPGSGFRRAYSEDVGCYSDHKEAVRRAVDFGREHPEAVVIVEGGKCTDAADSARSAKAALARQAREELDRYEPHRPSISSAALRKIRTRPLGTISGHRVYAVDGERVRTVHQDFVAGGTAGRYRYVPQHEVWVERTMVPTDFAPTVLHEMVENRLMQTRGLSYDAAHEKASEAELPMREAVARGKVKPRTHREAVRVAGEWYEKWERKHA